MTSPLIPQLSGRQLTVDIALKQPTLIRDQIARLADAQLILPKLFRPLGKPIEGGGLLYSVIKASDGYTTDIEKRAPGNEYRVVEGVDPESRLAEVDDWGGKFQVPDEQVDRNDVSYLDQQTTQLSNTIARKLDTAAVAAIEDAITAENTVTGHSWANLVTVGPLDALTPSGARPTADLSAAQLAADLQELGVKHDLLIVHPQQAHYLRVAYGDNLDEMLKSAGVGLFPSLRIGPGSAYVLAEGQAGVIGFERVLTVDTWDDRSTRSKWVQAYAVPAFAPDKPYALKKLIGLL
ncbi:major capsid protein [Nocardia sp. NPDC051981]|uniref:major capsid protein n=1 Tax=Nocardia sp. NPDC051981 TaxID=3155417 RepID=UPI0034227EB1